MQKTKSTRRLLAALFCSAALVSAAPAYAGFEETAKLTTSDGVADDRFGRSIAISGDTAIIGANGDDNGPFSGSAYLFNTTGDQLFKLTASDGASYDGFGNSVGISGNTAIVGAWRDDDNGDASGSAYLFDTITGNQLFKLTANDGTAIDQFGRSVGISGGVAIVGAYRDSDVGYLAGSAYLFDTSSGNQLFKLTAGDAAANDEFGISAALSGTTAIVGASGDDDTSGSAYLFDTTTGNQIAKLTASDGAADDRFGHSVAISGSTAVIGAYTEGENGYRSGSAYLFDTTTGNQIAKLTAEDGAVEDYFGYSVGISGTIAVIGARLDDDNGSQSGSAYLFDITTGNQIAKLTASDGAAADDFGIHVGISGDTAIIAATQDGDNGSKSGSVYIFDNIDENITVFSDYAFNSSDWTESIINATFPSSNVQTAHIQSGGNDGAYRQTTHNWQGPGGINTAHMKVGATIDPGEVGAIERIDVSFDAFTSEGGSPGAVRYAVLAEQDGNYFWVGGSEAFLDDGSGWMTFSATALEEGDYTNALGVGPLAPDLSEDGSPIQFGYYMNNGTGGASFQTTVSGIDNWQVIVTAVPEPSSLALLALGGLGLLRRRRN